MATFSKITLSASVNGKAIQVPVYLGPGNAGVVVHTTLVNAVDEIWLWAVNYATGTVTAGVQWGQISGTKEIVMPILNWPGNSSATTQGGLYFNQALGGAALIMPGLILTGGLAVRMYCSANSSLSVHGYVNRITP